MVDVRLYILGGAAGRALLILRLTPVVEAPPRPFILSVLWLQYSSPTFSCVFLQEPPPSVGVDHDLLLK